MRNLYWLITACALGVIVHIFTLLFIPSMNFERNLKGLTADISDNRFFVLPTTAQQSIFPEYPRGAVFGVCRFDLTAGSVALNANLPDTLWTLTVYTRSGKVIYTVNDEQSGTDSFKLELVRAPGILEIFSATGNEDNPVSSSGWRVSSSDERGYAVFWVPSVDQAMRAGFAETLAKSSCELLKV